MRPTFSITVAGENITDDVSARFVSLDISDTVDEDSDGMTLVLEDVEGTLALPKSGARLEVAIGYNGANTRVGSYVVDEVEVDGPPDVVTITASSTPFVSDRGGKGSSSFTSKKSRSWEGKTIGEIVAKIASECGLEPVVGDSLKNLTIPHISQVAETDANLLLRIARQYGAILKPADGRLVLADEAGGVTTSGKPLEASLTLSDVASYRFRLGGKMQGVTKVTSKTHNYETAEADEVTVDVDKDGGQFLAPEGASGEQVDAFYERVLADSGGDVETAKKSATATAKRIARSKKTCDLSMVGNTRIIAGSHMILSGFRQGNSGRYKVISVRHSITRNGWITSLSGEQA